MPRYLKDAARGRTCCPTCHVSELLPLKTTTSVFEGLMVSPKLKLARHACFPEGPVAKQLFRTARQHRRHTQEPTAICLEFTRFQANMEGQHRKVWDGLHVSSRLAPSKGAKLSTYFAWFFRPSQLRFEPYLDIPMSISRLRFLMQFRMGSHFLPVEQGRLARPMVPRQLRRCMLCNTHATGDERHYVFDCLHFAHIRRQFRSLFRDADGAMQSFMWHQNQKAVCHCLAAILTLADDSSMDASS